MTDPSPGPRPFLLGLTMAGSVSAGAYLAGVVDFLVRALSAHAAAHPDRPVILKVMSGTSGGGTSASLAVASLLDGLPGEGELHRDAYAAAPGASRAYSFALKRLHDIWVRELSLTGDGRGEGLLGTTDLDACREKGLPIPSLLSGLAIDRAADRALSGVRWTREAPYPFVAQPLDLFVTTTSLQGVVYKVTFRGGSSHRMSRHAMARHFAVDGLGAAPVGSAWLSAYRDDGLPLKVPPPGGDVDLRAREDVATPTPWTDLRETAIASGAFPIGLPSRFIRARMGEHQCFGAPAAGGAWPLDVPLGQMPTPDWGRATPLAEGEATYIAVDGGVANNEPFEYARYVLRAPADCDPSKTSDWLQDNPREEREADRAVVMVDAFPEGATFSSVDPGDPDDLALAGLPGMLGSLFGAMISQARFKPAELDAAASDLVRSRYMIAPSREQTGRDRPLRGSGLLAGGALGGFSGFLDLRFRQHDFILGQRNAQRFLQEHFVLHPAAAVFGDPDAANQPDGAKRPIVDLPPELTAEIEAPEAPRMTPAELQALRAPIETRLRRLVEMQVAPTDPSLLVGAGIGLAWRWVGRGMLVDPAMRTLEAALIEHGLFELPEALTALPRAADLPEALVKRSVEQRLLFGRRVLARLVAPGPHLRTAEAMADRFALARRRGGARPRDRDKEAKAIAFVLDRLAALDPDDPCAVTSRELSGGARGHALRRFAPGALRGRFGRLYPLRVGG